MAMFQVYVRRAMNQGTDEAATMSISAETLEEAKAAAEILVEEDATNSINWEFFDTF
jgi:hypothetical protein